MERTFASDLIESLEAAAAKQRAHADKRRVVLGEPIVSGPLVMMRHWEVVRLEDRIIELERQIADTEKR